MNSITNPAIVPKHAVPPLPTNLSGESLKLVAPMLSLTPTSPRSVGETTPMPQLATPNDLRDLIRFLKQRPDGVSLVEAMGELKKRILEPSKIQAYEKWGIITLSDDRFRLSPLGWEFAQRLASEAQLFCTILDSIKPYRSILELAGKQQLALLMESDVVRCWRATFPEFIQGLPTREIEAGVVSFLHLCHAAELGSLTIGKRGQPARLRIDLDALQTYLSAQITPSLTFAPPPVRAGQEQGKVRVSLSLSENNSFVDALLHLFALLNIEGKLIKRERAQTLLNSAQNFTTLRSCTAGVLILTAADCVQPEADLWELTPETQMEISAAYLFYNRKIILLHDARIHLPASWRDIRRCQFNEQGISWENGLALTQEIMQFQSESL